MEYSSAIFLASLLCFSLCFAQQDIFYVKASEGDTNCPPGFPCNTLQDYIDESEFTTNRHFIFLNGRHDFDGILRSENAVDLSLSGASSEVILYCSFSSSKIQMDGFTRLIIESLAMSGNCASPLISLNSGSNANLRLLEINPSAVVNRILDADKVGGTFSISDSNFAIDNSGIPLVIVYSDCTGENNFVYSNNTLLGVDNKLFDLQLKCNVDIAIRDSSFGNNNAQLNVEMCGWSRTLLISKSIFTRSPIRISFCPESFDNCSQDCLTFADLTMINSQLTFTFPEEFLTLANNSILIKNSIFSGFTSANEEVLSVVSNSGTTALSIVVTLDNVTFINNNALLQNYFFNASVAYLSCTFDYNSGTAIQAVNSEVFIYDNCTFADNVGTAIDAQNSEITFQGFSTFINNSDTFGGAIQLQSLSRMYLQEYASVLFINNHVDYLGGAIYIDREDTCFFESEPNVQVTFVNNTAYSGAAIYGNGIALCCENEDSCSNLLDTFDFSANPSAIGSDPSKVCLCDELNGLLNCPSSTPTTHYIDVFPGQEFSIHLAVVGIVLDEAVPGSVRAFFSPERSVLQNSQTLQKSDSPTCVDLKYSVNSTEKSEEFRLTIEQSFMASITGDYTSPALNVTAHLKNCPQGFHLSPKTRGCECHPDIEKHSVQCNINNQSFLLPPNSWMGFNDSCTGENCVVFSSNCPIGYCSQDTVSISSDDPDKPCNPNNRTGRLCGKCEGGYSIALGNQICMECSYFTLFLIIPMALAGLLLVVILFSLNLTVTEGTINGLLFYANIIGLYHRELFVLETSYLYPFLAWINLDFGINNICFYHGMDHFQEAWLEFIFPIYLWIIILVIVQLNRFPAFAAKFGGEKTVPVLATLLLMSFTKLIRAVATILSSTQIGTDEVWLYDASHDFFKGVHVYLGLVGIFVIVFLIIPYVLCVMFFQQFQACSSHRIFRWVNKLMPVFDAYASPYNDKYRFWTGLLLLVRIGLAITFICTQSLFVIQQSLNMNLLITVIVSLVLAVINSIGIYKNWPCSFLESFFLCQLGAFAAGVAYFKAREISIAVFSDISFGLSLLTFLGIVGYHGYLRFIECRRQMGYENIDEGNEEVIESRPSPTPTPDPSPSPSPSPTPTTCPSPDTY